MNLNPELDGDICRWCLKRVPAMNQVMHNAYCCGPPLTSASTPESLLSDDEDERKPAAIDLTNSPEFERVDHDMSEDSGEEEGADEEEEKPPAVSNDRSLSDDHEEEDDEEVIEYWPCECCTLHNSNDRSMCAACGASRPGAQSVRGDRSSGTRPDGSRARLVFSSAPPNSQSNPAFGAGLHSSLLQSFMQEASGPSGRTPAFSFGRTPPASLGRTAPPALLGRSVPPVSLGRTPVTSHQFIRGPNGRVIVLRRSAGSSADAHPFLEQMFSSHLLHGARGGSIDNMNYEQLLRQFGNGTENMGAAEHQIEQLPLTTIQDVEKELPEDHRSCSICLENFESGDERRMLPCLHGFHKECADKWLKTNGSCPICKHSVRS